MRLLIVDDNKYVVEGLKRQLNWSAFGIDEVIGCYSVSQAQKILENTEVDFLVSDIEMPGQDGFALLEWIEDREMSLEKVLLTSYADFHYAQAAVKHQCYQYLLKPVETSVLEEIFIGLVEKRVKDQKEQRLIQYGNDWLSHQNIVKEMFWRDVLDETVSLKDDYISRKIKRENLSYQVEEKFVISLICFEPIDEKHRMSEELLCFSCENVLVEISKKANRELEGILYNGPFQYVSIFALDDREKEGIADVFKSFMEVFVPFYHDRVLCYISESCRISEIPRHLRRLEEIHLDNLNRDNGIVWETAYRKDDIIIYQEPEVEIWKEMLMSGRKEALEKEIEDYFCRLRLMDTVSPIFLQAVMVDWDMMVHSVLKEHNITIYQLLTDIRDRELAELALKSVKYMEKMIWQEVQKIFELFLYVEKTDTIIMDIRQYIKDHLDSVTRSKISEVFYLSPNYLSKLFHKEAGISLSEYIQNERMNRAKQLLLQNQLTISQIATETGYPSFAHFSKQFKKFVGMTPNEYRKKN